MLIHLNEYELYLRGFRHMLRDSRFTEILSCATLREAADVLKREADAVFVTEIVFAGAPDFQPVRIAEALKRKTVVLSLSCDDKHMNAARTLGVSDYLTWSMKRDELVDRLTCVVEGRKSEWNAFGKARKQRRSFDLTEREKQVARHVALGLSNKEIGQALSISYETVKEHVAHLLRKAGVNDRTQLALWWTRQQEE